MKALGSSFLVGSCFPGLSSTSPHLSPRKRLSVKTRLAKHSDVCQNSPNISPVSMLPNEQIQCCLCSPFPILNLPSSPTVPGFRGTVLFPNPPLPVSTTERRGIAYGHLVMPPQLCKLQQEQCEWGTHLVTLLRLL